MLLKENNRQPGILYPAKLFMKGENKVVFTAARTQRLPSLVKEMSGLQITQEKQIYCIIFH